MQFVATARSTEIVEFYEALLPFVPKLTKEARGYLLEKKEVEKEKPALKAIASRGRKRSKPSGRK